MKKWLLTHDVVAVIVFVVAGRATHGIEDTVSGIVHTASPFLIALALGWMVTRAWRDPASLKVGAGVLATTVIVGMLLRRFVFDDGTQLSFVLVATAFLALFLLGWRVAEGYASRRRTVSA
jgi:uncharacterized membrane protein (Fun14 family)